MEQERQVSEFLQSKGLGRDSRVAIVLPNGPEMATAFLSFAGRVTTAPLNPGYRQAEFDFYLADLKAHALVTQAGLDSPAVTVAQERRIPILTLSPISEAEAGRFTLAGEAVGPPTDGEGAQPEDIALVLHTSGTTSRPKIVPLTQANLCHSARTIAATLALSEADRCLNVMPLFHIHGLHSGLLRPRFLSLA
jgi:acyl-CoA synthetase (AMP-forming)/AMP-acid ligase II